MRLAPLLSGLLVFCCFQTAVAGQKSVTCYLDAARVEQQVSAINGYLEYPLPDSLVPGSLRVKPLRGGTVLRVEVAAAAPDKLRNKEVARLEERKAELQDRMQALQRREEIFSAAVKSQTSKGLRKTKSNPEPLVAMKQGTEYALSQLDAVYREQRKRRQALEAVERDLAAAKRVGNVARIWLSGQGAVVSYLLDNGRWIPSYDLRWGGGTAGELLLQARLPKREKGVRYLISGGTVLQAMAAKPVQGDLAPISRHPLTLRATGGGDPPTSFSFAAVEGGLPPGEAAVYWRGEYVGSGRFAGGGANQLSIGGK